MPALAGVAVLVTRPEQQATPLCRLLESEGANVVRWAALQIEPSGGQRELLARLGPVEAFSLMVFTSANAARFGVPLLEPGRDAALAAIGPATARALGEMGYAAVLTPAEAFDSDALLAHPRLQDVAGRRILIVKGRQGRELLQAELTRRGAEVAVAEVYERRRVVHGGAELAALAAQFAAGTIDVITATSVEIAQSLLESADPALRRYFGRVPWLVPSGRVAAAVRASGVTAPILHAHSAEDHDLVAAIKRWRSSESGA